MEISCAGVGEERIRRYVAVGSGLGAAQPCVSRAWGVENVVVVDYDGGWAQVAVGAAAGYRRKCLRAGHDVIRKQILADVSV